MSTTAYMVAAAQAGGVLEPQPRRFNRQAPPRANPPAPQNAPPPAAEQSAWPWLTCLLVFIAFFLAVHQWDASQHWLAGDKGEIQTLTDLEAGGRAARQFGFLLLGAVGVTLLARPSRFEWRPAPLIAFSLGMLLAWTFISVAWSPDGAVSIKRLVVLICTLLAAAGLIRQYSLTRIVEMAAVQTLLVIVIGLIAEVMLHSPTSPSGDAYRFAGTLHPNHMGINASLLLLCSLFLAQQRRNWKFLILAAIAFVTIVETKSRTALSSAIIGAVVFALLAYKPRTLFRLGMAGAVATVAITVLGAMGYFSDVSQTVLMNRTKSDPTTLTGRTQIWQFALDRVRDDWSRMIAGCGYGGFWTEETASALSRRAQFPLAEGHNAYLDTMLQLGLAGLALYLVCLFGALWIWFSIARRTHLPLAAFAVGLICFTINHHIAESAMIAPTFPTLILWTVIGLAAARGHSAAEATALPASPRTLAPPPRWPAAARQGGLL